MGERHEPSIAVLVRTWAALVALTAATTAVAFVDLGPLDLAVALAIAALKAVLVAVVFMELRRAGRLVPLVAVGGLLWLVILFALAAADYAARPGGGFAG